MKTSAKRKRAKRKKPPRTINSVDCWPITRVSPAACELRSNRLCTNTLTVALKTPTSVVSAETQIAREASDPRSRSSTAPSASADPLRASTRFALSSEIGASPVNTVIQKTVRSTAAATQAATCRAIEMTRCARRTAKPCQIESSGSGQSAAPVNWIAVVSNPVVEYFSSPAPMAMVWARPAAFQVKAQSTSRMLA